MKCVLSKLSESLSFI